MNTRRVVLILAVAVLVLATQAAFAVAAPQPSDSHGYGCAAYYRVQFGDNLYPISVMYNVSMAALMQANGIYSPDLVYAGQTLCIPGATTPPPPPSSGCNVYYTVRYGDTLSGIAWRFGVPVYTIMQANNIQNPNWVYAGMILYIPCTAYYPPTSSGYSQWKGEYFNNPDLAGA